MQIVNLGDSLHEISKTFFGGKFQNILYWNFYPAYRAPL